MTDSDTTSKEGPSSKKKKKTRRSRSYRHNHCGGVTTVDDDDFSRLANPFAFVMGSTFCAECEQDVSLEDLYWTDTEESIADFRRRVRKDAPLSMKLTGWVGVPIGGFLIGAGIGAWIDGGTFVICGFGVIGLVMFAAFSMPVLSHYVWGIDYRQRK
jgi:hypothetical protein